MNEADIPDEFLRFINKVIKGIVREGTAIQQARPEGKEVDTPAVFERAKHRGLDRNEQKSVQNMSKPV